MDRDCHRTQPKPMPPPRRPSCGGTGTVENDEGREPVMARITFLPEPRGNAITIEADTLVGRRLLAVAKEHGIPILFTCEAGACGACLVKITGVAGAADLAAPPGEDEALLLRALAKQPSATGETSSAARDGLAYRLACQYIVPDAEIVVTYPRAVGGV